MLKVASILLFLFVALPGFAIATFDSKEFKFGINFVVLTRSSEALGYLESYDFSETIDLLNGAFKSAQISFEQVGVHFVNGNDLNCMLTQFGDHSVKPKRTDVYRAFNNCEDFEIKNPAAINFYLFSSEWEPGNPWKTSYAYFNWFEKPFVTIEWTRLGSGYKSAEVHELGHVFGLPHTPACGSDDSTPTDVMAGMYDFCEGTAGNRNLGFRKWQIEVIKRSARLVTRGFNR